MARGHSALFTACLTFCAPLGYHDGVSETIATPSLKVNQFAMKKTLLVLLGIYLLTGLITAHLGIGLVITGLGFLVYKLATRVRRQAPTVTKPETPTGIRPFFMDTYHDEF